MLTYGNIYIKIRTDRNFKMPKRPRHPNKEIENAITYAESHGWRYRKSGDSAHAWGRMLCPLESREGCAISIWSTPRSTYQHTDQIKRRVRMCPHTKENK